MPELLHHQQIFFGCLTVQRIARPALADSALSQEFERLAASLWHRLPHAGAETDDVLLATRGFDLGLSERCPALDSEQRCSLQAERKPAICRVVPLDALQPDRAQHLVLASREAEAHHFGSDCIAPGERSGFALVTRRLHVVDESARTALAQRRADLARERVAWGDRVFELLRGDLFSSESGLSRVPRNGFMTLSLAPVLISLLEHSLLSRSRCVAYLEAQGSLAQRMLGATSESAHTEHGSVRQLIAFARANARLLSQLKDA